MRFIITKLNYFKSYEKQLLTSARPRSIVSRVSHCCSANSCALACNQWFLLLISLAH